MFRGKAGWAGGGIEVGGGGESIYWYRWRPCYCILLDMELKR